MAYTHFTQTEFAPRLAAEIKILDGKPVRFRDVCVHTIKMGDVEDPDIYVAAPIWEWQQSDAGRFIMEHAVGAFQIRRRGTSGIAIVSGLGAARRRHGAPDQKKCEGVQTAHDHENRRIGKMRHQPAHQIGKEHATESAARGDNPENRAQPAGRKQIHRQGRQRHDPGHVCQRDNRHQRDDGEPGFDERNECAAGDEDGGRRHGPFARFDRPESALDQTAGKEAAGDAADIRREINGPSDTAEIGQGHAVDIHQVFGEPEQDEVPHRIGQCSRRQEQHSFATKEDVAPPPRRFGHCHGRRRRRPAANRWSVEHQPGYDPEETQCAGREKRPAPTVAEREKGDKRRRERGADRGPGGINSHGQTALRRRKQFADDLRRHRVQARLPGPEQEPRTRQRAERIRGPGQHVRERPPGDEQRHAESNPQSIRDPAGGEERQHVRKQEHLDDGGITQVRNAQVVLNRPRENRKTLTVDEVNDRREKQQRQNNPAAGLHAGKRAAEFIGGNPGCCRRRPAMLRLSCKLHPRNTAAARYVPDRRQK